MPKELNGHSPVDVLNHFESKSKSLGRRSLQSGIGDIVFIAQDLPQEIMQAINQDLIARGLPDFGTFKKEVNNTLEKVFKRSKIRNLDEYYIIKEYELDLTNDLSNDQRQLLSSYLSAFEKKPKPRD